MLTAARDEGGAEPLPYGWIEEDWCRGGALLRPKECRIKQLRSEEVCRDDVPARGLGTASPRKEA